MHRQRRVNRDAVCGEIRLMGGEVGDNLAARHAPREICIAAESLLIHVVAPPADALREQKAYRADIQQIAEIQLVEMAYHPSRQQAADDAAIDRHPAFPDFKNIEKMILILLPFKDHIKQPRADDAAEGAKDQNIHHLIKAHLPLICHPAAEQHGKQEAERNDNAVPMDCQVQVDAGDREVRQDGRNIKAPPKLWELHHCEVMHCKLSFA